MSTLTKYILQKYLRNFIIVLISLEIFFVGMDFLQNFKSIPQSANLQLLYIAYNSFFTLTLALPLSIVFAWIITIVIFVRSNEFVAFNAVGARKRDILNPIMATALLLILSLIALQTTPLAYSYEHKKKILDNEYFSSTKSDIFLKYNDYFIYFEKFLPLEKKAENIHIFKIRDNNLLETIVAKKAYFQSNKWYIVDAKIAEKPEIVDEDSSKLNIRYEKFLNTLDGFKPKILDNVYESKSEYSLIDAVEALVLLKEHGVNTQKIRTNIYNQLFIPFFVIPILLLIYSYTAINSRFFETAKFISLTVFGTLIVWGVFFMLFKVSSTSSIDAEITMLLPLLIWFIASSYIYYTKIKA